MKDQYKGVIWSTKKIFNVEIAKIILQKRIRRRRDKIIAVYVF
jgi:hypothetical protein